jgi:NAD(P)-dependent dehydrogenase (short-subunit alcohol dehydrogenase family)
VEWQRGAIGGRGAALRGGPGMASKRVVVITGGSAGVGRATAREFARRGYRIGLIARGDVGLNATAREVEALGGRALMLPCDVTDSGAIEEAAERAERAFGPIDVWINNAMVSVFAPVHLTRADEFRRVCEVTYLGQVYGALAALKRMLPRDRGRIIFVGSALAYRGIPLQSAYCAAKHAIQGFFDSLRTELLHERSGVIVTMVQLPAMNTPQFRWSRSRMPREARPVPPIFQPEVAARAIAYAADHDRREILVGGPTVKAVWGNKVAPGLADRWLARHGYESQMTDEPRDTERPDNLERPVEGDFGARGVFDADAREFSAEAWATEHRGWLLAGLLSLAGLAAGAAWAAGWMERGGKAEQRTGGARDEWTRRRRSEQVNAGSPPRCLIPSRLG